MGSVIIVYNILPDSPENFDSMRKGLDNLNPKRIEEEPLAFGLKSIKVTFIIPEESGKEDEMESKIRQIPHVNSVETVAVSRSL